MKSNSDQSTGNPDVLVAVTDNINQLLLSGDEYCLFDMGGKLIRKSLVLDSLLNGISGVYCLCVYKESKLIQSLRIRKSRF